MATITVLSPVELLSAWVLPDEPAAEVSVDACPPPNAEGCVSLMPELSKLKNAIGFHQQVSFKEGILETIKGEQVK